MQSGFAPRRGPILTKTPTHREQAVRRRLVVICGILALALASGLIGSLMHPAHVVSHGPPQGGPFTYFPSS
jgi:hypothetical protein